MNRDLIFYYKARAAEYENIWHLPERQQYLQQAAAILQEIVSGKSILKIACGTGYQLTPK